ncbi:hypothetical protein Sgleb_39910 [Streptomyces glebosus]|uniref:Pyridoxamine 5'-phosphate oxidase n=2 Tax=Streptomyces glebosus TaxID=249580 RepID=A0A640SYI4_9ACTN|nr:hypothetical protein Sgleb_39910 [Streptomyces glebosus]GHG85759.1 hypothetical protein GCM10010513_66640 [Streptomyces glebosus]
MNYMSSRPRAGAPRAGGAGTAGPRHSTPLHRAEALRLLGSVSLGRIVFTQDALPAIRPVNHLLDRGEIIIRTQEGAAVAAATRQADMEGVVVAYEVDTIDPVTHVGWSVVVTGYCRPVTDPRDLAYYWELLHPWTEGQREHALRIRPDLVTGLRITAALPASATGSRP